MTLRSLRTQVKAGRILIIKPEIVANDMRARRRIEEAISTALDYFNGDRTTKQIGRANKVTEERAAQIIRRGVKYMLAAGSFRTVEESAPDPSGQPPSGDQGHD